MSISICNQLGKLREEKLLATINIPKEIQEALYADLSKVTVVESKKENSVMRKSEAEKEEVVKLRGLMKLFWNSIKIREKMVSNIDLLSTFKV